MMNKKHTKKETTNSKHKKLQPKLNYPKILKNYKMLLMQITTY